MRELDRLWNQMAEENGWNREAEISRLERDPNLERMYMISEGSDDCVSEAYERKCRKNRR